MTDQAPMGSFESRLEPTDPAFVQALRITMEGDLFVAVSRYEHRDILRGAGFWWDARKKRWTTRHADVAYRLIDYAAPEAKAKLETMRAQHEQSIAASKATDAAIEIPVPPGLAYMPFQKAGIAFALARKHTLIGDEMGLGKTPQSIGISVMQRARSVLVICPASLKINWSREIKRWDVLRRGVLIGTSKPSPHIADALRGLLPLDDEIRREGFDKREHVSHSVQGPSVLGLAALDGPATQTGVVPEIDTTTVLPKERDDLCVGVVEGDSPRTVALPGDRTVPADASLSVNDARHVGEHQAVGRDGHSNRPGALGTQGLAGQPQMVIPESPGADGELVADLFNRNAGGDASKGDEQIRIGNASGPSHGGFFLILNYDIVHNWLEVLKAFGRFDLLILDEVHLLKNPKARRTNAVFGGEWRTKSGDIVELEPIAAERTIALTGTPIVNRPYELWTLVRAFDPEGLGSSWFRFTRRYCNAFQTGFGTDTDGASNLEELQDRLRASIMVRRLKKDVLTELPPKRRSIMALEPEGEAAGLVAEEKAAWERAQQALEQLRVAAELAKAEGEAVFADAVAKLRNTFTVSFTEISRIRHELALKKIPYIIEYVKDAALDKIVVMVHHQDVAEAIAAEFGESCVVVHGGIRDLKIRQDAVDAFQNDPKVSVFVGTIRAAGVGLTLTAASHVVFGELDWTPGNMSQAEDRCHRIGQRESVNVQHLVFDESLDARMAQILVEKQEIIDKALDRAHEGEPVYEKMDTAVLPVFTEKAATEDTSRKEVEEQAEKISPAQIEAIHLGLRILAGMDADFAAMRNDMGFSRFDVKIGHSLAERPYITPKQAVLGLKLVNKYRRQLPADLLAQAKGETSN